MKDQDLQQECDKMGDKSLKIGDTIEAAGSDDSSEANLTDTIGRNGTKGEGCKLNGKGTDEVGNGLEKGFDLTTVGGNGKDAEGTDGDKSTEDGTGEKHKKCTRDGPLVLDTLKGKDIVCLFYQ